MPDRPHVAAIDFNNALFKGNLFDVSTNRADINNIPAKPLRRILSVRQMFDIDMLVIRFLSHVNLISDRRRTQYHS